MVAKKTKAVIALSACALAFPPALAQDAIEIVGSSTVYPFSTVVSDRFARSKGFPAPKIESTGSGGGMKLFCSGVGDDTPDITNSSRRIKKSEFEKCQANGVGEIVEVLIGYDGIVVAQSQEGKAFSLTLPQLFLGLAKDIPNGGGALKPNPHKTWRDVDGALPDVEIRVYGPPPTSGTRDAFAELAMEGGCKSIDAIAALKKSDGKKYKAVCHSVREDGAYIEAGENDNLIVQKLTASPGSLGIFGFSFLEENSDKVRGLSIDGVPPEFETIADFQYPVSRPLYFYVKKAHLGKTPGLQEFAKYFVNDAAIGEDGFLVDRGLIPLGDDSRRQTQGDVRTLKNLAM